jgi:hypothetical protein
VTRHFFRGRRGRYRLLFEIDISPCAIQELSSSQASRKGNDNQQVPPQASLFIGSLDEIASRFQNVFTFIIAVDIDLTVRTPWHRDKS